MSFKKDVITKLDVISEKQIDHTIQLASNTRILEEHHKRSTNLEERVAPIENHVMFINKAVKVLSAILAACAAIAGTLAALNSYLK